MSRPPGKLCALFLLSACWFWGDLGLNKKTNKYVRDDGGEWEANGEAAAWKGPGLVQNGRDLRIRRIMSRNETD